MESIPDKINQILEIVQKQEKSAEFKEGYPAYSENNISLFAPKSWSMITEKDDEMILLQQDAASEHFGKMVTKPVLLLRKMVNGINHSIMIGVGTGVKDDLELLIYGGIKTALRFAENNIFQLDINPIFNESTIGSIHKIKDSKIYLIQKWVKKKDTLFVMTIPNYEKSTLDYDPEVFDELKEIIQSINFTI